MVKLKKKMRCRITRKRYEK